MSWEIRKVAESENILNIIKKVPKPVGVLVFGPDFSSKEATVDKICSHMNLMENWGFVSKESEKVTKKLLSMSQNDGYMVILSGEDSIDHKKRHDVVKIMREIVGLKTIIGVYVKEVCCMNYDVETALKNTMQLAELAESPPTPDGLDWLIIVR